MILGPDAFVGRWKLARHIEDRHGGQDGQFSGQARFYTTSPTHLSYSEAGELRFARAPAMRAERKYNWVFEGSEVIVTFEDGRAFHRFTPQGVGAGTDHPCGEDYYTVAYDFTLWPLWEAVWTVRGPRKDYTSTSRYMRD